MSDWTYRPEEHYMRGPGPKSLRKSSDKIRFGLLRQQRRRNAMVRGYSNDLRARAVALVEEGESRREVARLLNVAASTAVRWLNLWTTTGSVEDKPCAGHSRSPLKAHEDWLLHLVAKEPDLTLEEIRKRLRREKKLGVAVSSVWRFYDRHEITFKKSPPCV